MARKAMIEKNLRRQEIALASKTRRDELRKLAKTGDRDAQRALNKMRRDSSPCRSINRDSVDGRPRANMRKFGVSRITFRKLAHEGKIPGVKKASW